MSDTLEDLLHGIRGAKAAEDAIAGSEPEDREFVASSIWLFAECWISRHVRAQREGSCLALSASEEIKAMRGAARHSKHWALRFRIIRTHGLGRTP